MKMLNMKCGFIGIEMVIIASLVMSFGALSLNRTAQQGQGTTDKFDKAYEHTSNVVQGGDGLVDNEAEELPEEGEDAEPEIRYETKWYYGGVECPELPADILEYEWNAIGEVNGFITVLGASYIPEWRYQKTYVTNVFTGEESYIDGNFFVWDNPTTNSLKYNSYVLVNGTWIQYDSLDYDNLDFYTSTFTLTANINAYHWSNKDVMSEDGSVFMEGSQPEQKQVEIK